MLILIIISYQSTQAVDVFVDNNYKFTQFLSLGSTGNEVRQLQNKLKTLGLFNYPAITGYYGPVTKNAIKTFQQAHGLSPVGYVGPQTREALKQ